MQYSLDFHGSSESPEHAQHQFEDSKKLSQKMFRQLE
jgi:hypothetical protein